jgi:hypothetical protein
MAGSWLCKSAINNVVGSERCDEECLRSATNRWQRGLRDTLKQAIEAGDEGDPVAAKTLYVLYLYSTVINETKCEGGKNLIGCGVNVKWLVEVYQ